MPAFRLLAVPAALCLFAACGGSDSPSSPSAPTPPTANPTSDIDIPSGAQVSGLFSPNPKNVSLNGGASVSIRWVNRDYSGSDYNSTSVTHHIVSLDNPTAFNPSPLLGGNDTYTITLTAPGDYPYECSIHTNMKGTIHVNP